MCPIRLLIADDHPVVRDGLRAMLATQPDMELVGEAATGTQAVAQARALHPDVVLMDLQMPDLDGPSAIAALREQAPEIRVLVLTTYGTDADITRAVDAGATGYLLKDAPREQLFNAIRSAARGESVLSPSVATRVLGRMRAPAEEALSPRELEILQAVARGLSNKDIGRQLYVSEATVKTHLLRVFSKLGVDDAPPRSPSPWHAASSACPAEVPSPRCLARHPPSQSGQKHRPIRCSNRSIWPVNRTQFPAPLPELLEHGALNLPDAADQALAEQLGAAGSLAIPVRLQASVGPGSHRRKSRNSSGNCSEKLPARRTWTWVRRWPGGSRKYRLVRSVLAARYRNPAASSGDRNGSTGSSRSTEICTSTTGLALDLVLGHKTRPHADLEISMLASDQKQLFRHLRGWDLRLAAPGQSLPRWDGSRIEPPFHQVWARRGPGRPATPEEFAADTHADTHVIAGRRAVPPCRPVGPRHAACHPAR